MIVINRIFLGESACLVLLKTAISPQNTLLPNIIHQIEQKINIYVIELLVKHFLKEYKVKYFSKDTNIDSVFSRLHLVSQQQQNSKGFREEEIVNRRIIRRIFDDHESAAELTWESSDDSVEVESKHEKHIHSKFSKKEIKNLLIGVETFGMGNWKAILENYDFNSKRTASQLKVTKLITTRVNIDSWNRNIAQVLVIKMLMIDYFSNKIGYFKLLIASKTVLSPAMKNSIFPIFIKVLFTFIISMISDTSFSK